MRFSPILLLLSILLALADAAGAGRDGGSGRGGIGTEPHGPPSDSVKAGRGRVRSRPCGRVVRSPGHARRDQAMAGVARRVGDGLSGRGVGEGAAMKSRSIG